MLRPRLGAVAASVTAALTLAGSLAVSAPAHAADAAVSKAADYVVANYAPNPSTENAGGDIDTMLGLVAAGPAYATQATLAYHTAMANCGAPGSAAGTTYGSGSAGTAAKCALAAGVAGDTTAAQKYLNVFAGTDWSKVYVYSQGQGAAAYVRAGLPVPQSLVDALVAASTPDAAGHYPLEAAFGKQLDSAGLILAALTHLPTQTPAVVQATKDMHAYVAQNQQADGSWLEFSPVNTTALVAPAVGSAGDSAAQQRGTAYIEGRQNADGGLPSTAAAGASNFMATTQGLLGLANATYFDLKLSPATTPEQTPPPTDATGTATPLEAATAADCAAQGGVWVVVADHGEATRRGCVAVTGKATALQALQALTSDVTTQDTSFGPQICTIDGRGTCAWDDATQLYWAFWQAGAVGSDLGYADVGAGSYVPAPGSVIGFDWSTGAAAPAAAQAADAPLPAASTPPQDSSTPEPGDHPTTPGTPAPTTPEQQPTTPAGTTPTATPTSATAAGTNPGLAQTGGEQATWLFGAVVALGLGASFVAKRK